VSTHRPVATPSDVHLNGTCSTMIAALGILAATLSIAVIWPQVWRSCRHGRTLGLSPTACWLAVALNLCWFTFGFLIGDLPQMVTNAVVAIGNTAVLTALLIAQPHLRSRELLLRTALGAAGLAGLAAGSLAAIPLVGADPAAVAATLGSVIGLVAAAAALPQPVSLLRDRTQDLSGLSPARWRLGAGSAASWTSYGWLLDQPVVWLSAGFGLGCALVVCTMLSARPVQPPVAAPVEARGVVTAAVRRRAGGRVRSAHVRPALAAA
jgi:uncharacterized protein with PQ loop repeat